MSIEGYYHIGKLRKFDQGVASQSLVMLNESFQFRIIHHASSLPTLTQGLFLFAPPMKDLIKTRGLEHYQCIQVVEQPTLIGFQALIGVAAPEPVGIFFCFKTIDR